jgi:ferredoxin-type protein NapH
VTGLHRNRVIPGKNGRGDFENAAGRDPRSIKRNAIARKVRWFFVVGLGGILANGYYKVLGTKAVYDGPLKSACVPFLNCHACPTAYCSCPIGMLQHFASIRQFPFFLAGFLGTIGMTFGRAACGWLCPFGWIQDVLYRIKTPKIVLARGWSKLKYVFLVVLAILLPFFAGAHWFSKICPWGTLAAGIPWALWNPVDPNLGEPVIAAGLIGWAFVLKITVLVFFLTLFVFIKRPFCRTTCPLGAVYSMFNRFSLMQMTAEGKCSGCGLCRKVCPVDIRISDDPASPECIRCLECTVCKGVRVRWGKRT